MKNVFYFIYLNEIGGVESFFYYLAKKYSNKDITIYYKFADVNQIKRLSKFVRVKRYTGEKITCDKIFFNYSIDIIDNVEANEYIQIIHSDYKSLGKMPKFHHKIKRYIGVSKYICESFKELTGKDIELCYNPILVDKPNKVINLISATRLTEEKGKHRIIKLANILNKANVKYNWTIFTDDINAIDNPNIIYRKPRLDIIDYIADSDFLVQLSDNEAYCYSVIEALNVGTPVIVTDCPVFKELGLNENNSIILDFNLNNVPIDKIKNGIENFVYNNIDDNWNNILDGESSYNYEEEVNTIVRVKPIKVYHDMELNKLLSANSPIFKTNLIRAKMLQDMGVVKILKG